MHTHNQAHSAPVTGLHAAIVEAGTDAMQAADVVATANMATAQPATAAPALIASPAPVSAPAALDLADVAEETPEADPNTHTLETPIVRGGGKQTITAITLRKPRSGELRGASLSDLVNLDVSALSKVLPRISTPTLTEHDVANLDPVDLVQLGGIFMGFLMPKAVKASMASLTA